MMEFDLFTTLHSRNSEIIESLLEDSKGPPKGQNFILICFTYRST
jgi:hypothetical protein